MGTAQNRKIDEQIIALELMRNLSLTKRKNYEQEESFNVFLDFICDKHRGLFNEPENHRELLLRITDLPCLFIFLRN